jgi:hypothetical protein
MAATSGLYTDAIRQICIKSGAAAIDLDTDAFKVALASALPADKTKMQSATTTDIQYAGGTKGWTEIAQDGGGGGTKYTTAGKALITPALTNTTGNVKWTDSGDGGGGAGTLQWGTSGGDLTTITAALGALVYSTTATSSPLLAQIVFSQAYSCSGGTFKITWDTNGIFYITVN